MKKILLLLGLLLLSACYNQIQHQQEYSSDKSFQVYEDAFIRFEYPTTATLDSSKETIALELHIEKSKKRTGIWINDRLTSQKISGGHIEIFEAQSPEEADTFLNEKIIGKHCSYNVVDERNGIEKLEPYIKEPEVEGPGCIHASYQLFRKGNTIIYEYIGQECVLYSANTKAKYECEEFIDFQVK